MNLIVDGTPYALDSYSLDEQVLTITHSDVCLMFTLTALSELHVGTTCDTYVQLIDDNIALDLLILAVHHVSSDLFTHKLVYKVRQ